MKFTTISAVVFMACGISGFANAAPTAIESGIQITADAAGCEVLGEAVSINLSTGVSGAYNCDVTLNAINVGACHAAGSRTDQVKCVVVGEDANAAPVYNDPVCTATNVGTTVVAPSPRFIGYRASTTGGSVGAQQLTTVCNDTSSLELVTFQ